MRPTRHFKDNLDIFSLQSFFLSESESLRGKCDLSLGLWRSLLGLRVALAPKRSFQDETDKLKRKNPEA
jgi:hypothetical protein